jgi:hypothetical protein
MAGRQNQIAGETNPILTKFAAGYKAVNGIAQFVAPIVESLTPTGTLFSFGKEGFYLYDTERALRANAKKIDFHLSKDTYACTEHALEASLDYKELEAAEKYGAQEVLKLKQRSINLVQNALQVELEKAVAAYLFDATYYASGNKATLSGTSQWSDTANSNPISAIKTGMAAARADMGVDPNTLVLGYTAFNTLIDHPAIIERVKYSMKAVITEELLAQLLNLKNVYVGRKVYSTDAGVFTDIWGDYAALIYVPEAGELVEGTTPHTIVIEEKGYPEVKTYQEKKVESYEVTRKYQVKNVSTSNGYLFTDTTA